MAKNIGKRIYRGNHPNGDKYQLVAIFPHVWACYQRVQPHLAGNGWLNFKLAATVPQPHKANFWLGVHVGDSRWALTRDCQTLADNCPAMAEAVMRLAGAIDAAADGSDWRSPVLSAWAEGLAEHPDWEVDDLPAWGIAPRDEVVTAQKIGRVMAARAGHPEGALLIWPDAEHVLFGRAVRQAFSAVDNSGVLHRVDFPF